jgi:hypothetical protein
MTNYDPVSQGGGNREREALSLTFNQSLMFLGLKKRNNKFNYFFLNFIILYLYLSEIGLGFLIPFPHFQQVRGTVLARRKRAWVAKFWAWQWGQRKTLLIIRYSLFVIGYSSLVIPSFNE